MLVVFFYGYIIIVCIITTFAFWHWSCFANWIMVLIVKIWVNIPKFICVIASVFSSIWSTGTPTSTVCLRRLWQNKTAWLLLECFLRYARPTCGLDNVVLQEWTLHHLDLCCPARVGGKETRRAAEAGRCSACYQTQGWHGHTHVHAGIF